MANVPGSSDYIAPFRLEPEFVRLGPDMRRVGAQIDRNFDEIKLKTGGLSPLPGIIDFGDGLVYTGYSKEFRPLQDVVLESVIGTVSAASTSGDITANIFKNDVNIGTVTIAVGEKVSPTLTLDTAFTASDFWQALVATAGTGASGLTFYGTFR